MEAARAPVGEYPFDTDHLRKGSVVSREVVAEAYGVKVDDRDYWKAHMRALAYVERRLRERGEPATVVTRDGGIAVLTDDEASIYNASRFEGRVDGMRRDHGRMQEVDRGAVAPARVAAHDVALVGMGRQLGAVVRARRELVPPKPTQRATPGLIGPQED